MTWITKAAHDQAERAKWREQANKSAVHLKAMQFTPEQEQHMLGFVFDDAVVNVRVEVALVQRMNEQTLADWIFEAVLAKVDPIAAQQEAVAASPSSSSGEAALPADAAVPCMRKLEPEYTQACPNHSAGGLKITLRPGEAVEKRWGLVSLLTFVMDLTVCPACLPKVNIFEITDQELRSRIGKAAQQMNNGVLVDWKRTVIEHVGFDNPQYKALRAEMAKQAAANEFQPAPAGPQLEGAGNAGR